MMDFKQKEEFKKWFEQKVEETLDDEDAKTGGLLNLFIGAFRTEEKDKILQGLQQVANYYTSKNPEVAKKFEVELGVGILKDLCDKACNL